MPVRLSHGRRGERAHLAGAFQRGIDPKDPATLGYHGTSVHTLLHATRTGSLPVARGLSDVSGGSSYKGRRYGLHLVPNPLNPHVRALDFRNPLHAGFKSPMEDALGWARHVARRHHTILSRGMDLGRAAHHRAADRIIAGEDPRDAMKRVKTSEPDPKAMNAGVVIAISDEALKRFGISVGGDGNDINLETTRLPLEYVTGIEPADDSAFHWLDTLSDGA